MIHLLVRAFVDRAEQIVSWETGGKPDIVQPRLASLGTNVQGNETIEFRIKVEGIVRRTYVVTVSEVAE